MMELMRMLELLHKHKVKDYVVVRGMVRVTETIYHVENDRIRVEKKDKYLHNHFQVQRYVENNGVTYA